MKYQPMEVPSQVNQPMYAQVRVDDEIDLIDLLRTLLSHKRLILITTSLAIFLGLLLVFLLPANLQVKTRLEIGAYQNISTENKGGLIEVPGAVVAKMKSGYIPRVIHQYNDKYGENLSDNSIQVSMPKNSNIIVLNSQGSNKDIAMLSAIQQQSTQALLDDHNQRTQTRTEELRLMLTSAELELEQLQNEELFQLKLSREMMNIKLEKNRLSDIQDTIKTIKSGLEKVTFEETLLKQEEKILQQRYAKVNSLLTSMDIQRDNAVKTTSDSNSVMTLMLLDNERRQLYDRQSDITSTINLELKEKARDISSNRLQLELELDKTLRDEKQQAEKITLLDGEIVKLKYERNLEIQNQKQNIQALNAKLTGIIPTSVIVGPVQSDSESKQLLFLILTAFAGFVISLLLVGLLELRKKLKASDRSDVASPLTTVTSN